MSFDNLYENRKDKRRNYYNSKAIDRSCRNHGDCSWCERNRLKKRILQEQDADEQIKEWKDNL